MRIIEWAQPSASRPVITGRVATMGLDGILYLLGVRDREALD